MRTTVEIDLLKQEEILILLLGNKMLKVPILILANRHYDGSVNKPQLLEDKSLNK